MKILVLRPQENLRETVDRFRNEGFEVYGCPFIELEFVEFEVPDHDYAIVTSQILAKEICRRKLNLKKVICIGRKTAEVLEECGFEVFFPSRFDSETLVKEFLNELRGKKVVVLKSDAENSALKKLSKLSNYVEIIAYKIRKLKGEEQREVATKACEGFFDVVVLSSSLIAENFFELCAKPKAKVVAIGPPTSKVVKKFGLDPIVPNEFSFDGILEIIRGLRDGGCQY